MNNVVEDHSAQGTVVPRALFTAQEVAVALSVSTTLVRQLTLDGAISCRRIGRLVRYAPADIDAFVSAREERGY